MPALEGLRILVVEDDPAVARAVARLLRRVGDDVTVKHGYREALRCEARFDCAVFDVDLPDGSGVDLAAAMTNDGRVRRAVFFSASADPMVARRAAKLGAFVHKSEGVKELCATVAQVLGRRRRRVAGGADVSSSTPPRPGSGERKRRG